MISYLQQSIPVLFLSATLLLSAKGCGHTGNASGVIGIVQPKAASDSCVASPAVPEPAGKAVVIVAPAVSASLVRLAGLCLGLLRR